MPKETYLRAGAFGVFYELMGITTPEVELSAEERAERNLVFWLKEDPRYLPPVEKALWESKSPEQQRAFLLQYNIIAVFSGMEEHATAIAEHHCRQERQEPAACVALQTNGISAACEACMRGVRRDAVHHPILQQALPRLVQG